MDYLPKYPAILVSSVNMLLRDEEYDTLEALALEWARKQSFVLYPFMRSLTYWYKIICEKAKTAKVLIISILSILPFNDNLDYFSQISFYDFLFASFAKKQYFCTVTVPVFSSLFSQECEKSKWEESFAKKIILSSSWLWECYKKQPLKSPTFDNKKGMHLRKILRKTPNNTVLQEVKASSFCCSIATGVRKQW